MASLRMFVAAAGVVRPELFALAFPDPPATAELVAIPVLPTEPAVGDSCATTVTGENDGLAGDDISKCEAPDPPPGSVKMLGPLEPAPVNKLPLPPIPPVSTLPPGPAGP